VEAEKLKLGKELRARVKTRTLRYTATMLMVIFGAGASFDSSQAFRDPEREPWRPPLAKNLFLDRYRDFGSIVAKYPKLTHILPYLREPTNGRSVEQVLESLQEEGKGNAESQRELASVRFYLCELLSKVTDEWSAQTSGATNYAPLVRDILRFNTTGEEVCLVTFNYDLLLERALVTFGYKTRQPDEHLVSHPTLKLFKLHGSVSWSRLVDLPEGTRLHHQALIDQADTIKVTDRFVLANATNASEAHNFRSPIFPAIAIPVQTKSDEHFECPLSHRDYLAKMLPHVTRILIIGWQAKEAHFLRMLQSNLPKLTRVMVVGADEADARGTLRYFLREIGLYIADSSVGRGGFTSFVVNQEGDAFFKA
jgi:SIR2-like protein